MLDWRNFARGRVVVLTFELDELPAWQQEFLHEGLVQERPRFPAIEDIASALGGRTRVERIPTPGDCTDGFFEAFWRRPEALLDPGIRSAQSMWGLLGPGVEQRIVELRLRATAFSRTLGIGTSVVQRVFKQAPWQACAVSPVGSWNQTIG